MKEREIKGDFKNERGKIKEEDGEKGEGAEENSGDGNNERENLMERQRSKKKEVMLMQCSQQFVLPLQHL